MLIHKETREKIVMKESKPEDKIKDEYLKYIKKEGNIFRILHNGMKVRFDNLCIVKYFHSFITEDRRYIILMEHCDGGDLETYINKIRNK